MNHAKKKKNFVLLEILIAFALVSISILPFLHYPFQHMQKEIELLFEMELEKIAQEELVAVQISLYKNEIEPEWIFGKEAKKRQIKETDEVKVELFKGWNRTYLKKVYIERKKQKQSPDRMLTVFVNIEVELFSKKDLENAALSAKTSLVAQKKI